MSTHGDLLTMVEQGQLFSKDLLLKIRERYALIDMDSHGNRRIYFENAGGSLTLKSALESAKEIAAIPDNSGRQNDASGHVGDVISQAREDLSVLLNARKGSILPGESTTSNIFRILDAVTEAGTGTNIVCTNLDHASLYDATRYFADKHGLEMRVAELDIETGSVPCDAIERLVDEGTVAVGFIHASNVTGVKNNANQIIQAIRKKNPSTIIIVDGAQHAQHCLVDVEDLDADAYLIAVYKLFSKVGLTFSYVGPRVASLQHWKLHGKPVDCWDLGTQDASSYAAFSQSIAYLCWLGKQIQPGLEDRRDLIISAMRAIESHEMALTDLLLNGYDTVPGLCQIEGVSIHGYPMVTDQRESVFAINLEGFHAKDFVRECVGNGIVVHDRQSDAYTKHTLQAMGIDQCVRVSLAHYNSPREVESFLRLTAQLSEKINFKVDNKICQRTI